MEPRTPLLNLPILRLKRLCFERYIDQRLVSISHCMTFQVLQGFSKVVTITQKYSSTRLMISLHVGEMHCSIIMNAVHRKSSGVIEMQNLSRK